MSSDDDDEPTGRTKRLVLNKSRRIRMRTLADSSDDEDEQLFDDPVDEDDEDEDDEDDDDGQDNLTYSSESLRKALVRTYHENVL